MTTAALRLISAVPASIGRAPKAVIISRVNRSARRLNLRRRSAEAPTCYRPKYAGEVGTLGLEELQQLLV